MTACSTLSAGRPELHVARHSQPGRCADILNSHTTNLLFVYGTLRRGFCRHPILRRLGAKRAGEGSIPARLYDLGKFPGAVRSGGLSTRVDGELYALRGMKRALRILDAMEGFDPTTPAHALFTRETVEVTLPDNRRVIAWVYLLNHLPSPRRRIISGDYTAVSNG